MAPYMPGDSGTQPSPPLLYELYAVIVHSGGASSGHYYTLIKSGEASWIKMNDAFSSEVSAEDFSRVTAGGPGTSESAYMLFYGVKHSAAGAVVAGGVSGSPPRAPAPPSFSPNERRPPPTSPSAPAQPPSPPDEAPPSCSVATHNPRPVPQPHSHSPPDRVDSHSPPNSWCALGGCRAGRRDSGGGCGGGGRAAAALVTRLRGRWRSTTGEE